MGWFYTHAQSKKEICDYIRSQKEVLDTRVVDNNLWALINFDRGDEAPSRGIALFLLDRSDGEWGYKSIDEGSGPLYYNCPITLLRKASNYRNLNPNTKDDISLERSTTWRKKALLYHLVNIESNTLKKSAKLGDTINVYGRTFTLASPISNGVASVQEIIDGKPKDLFRISRSQLNDHFHEAAHAKAILKLDHEYQALTDIFQENTDQLIHEYNATHANKPKMKG